VKHRNITSLILVGALCTTLAIPTFVKGELKPLQSKDLQTTSIGYEIKHWSRQYIDQLLENYDVESIFFEKDLNEAIKKEDFQNLVKLVIDKDYDRCPDTTSREAVVHELTKLWAEETGKELKNIPVIKMLIYSDTHEIDPKYSHSVTVAYMCDIAKGRGAGVFDPKSDVTYGELAALINNTVKAIGKELNTGEKPVEEGRFETRASYKIEDDKVVFDFQLINHYPEQKQLMFGSGQQFELIITDEKGEEVYRYSDDKVFTLAIVYKDINPGESLKWQDEWDMRNKDGEKLESGKYKAEIRVIAIQEDDDQKIDKSQLTTVMSFVLNNESQEQEIKDKKIIQADKAKEIIEDIADKVIGAISQKDGKLISEFVHPVKGVRFTPYTHVSLENDVVFNKEEISDFFTNQEYYLWGYYDGIGEPISLTPSQYYDRFIYSKDFMNVEEVGYNEVLSYGNMLENQFEVYDNAIVVEYYFPGISPDFGGMDWESLRLVFKQYGDSWYLVGIIHNQWTI